MYTEKNAAEHQNTKDCQSFLYKAIDDPVAAFIGGLFVFTVALAIATVRLFQVTKSGLADAEALTQESLRHADRSARAAEEAIRANNESSERQIRAYLCITKHKMPTDNSTLVLTIKNCGQTPALSVSCRNNFQWHPPGDHLPENFDWPDYPNTYMAINGYWGPLQELPVTLDTDPEMLERVRLGVIILYVYGHIDYVDWFGKRRSLNTVIKACLLEMAGRA